jgi:hypothetical protein
MTYIAQLPVQLPYGHFFLPRFQREPPPLNNSHRVMAS